jgi:hypothetical protein
VAFCRKSSLIFIQLQVDGIHLVEPWEVADELAKYFKS